MIRFGCVALLTALAVALLPLAILGPWGWRRIVLAFGFPFAFAAQSIAIAIVPAAAAARSPAGQVLRTE